MQTSLSYFDPIQYIGNYSQLALLTYFLFNSDLNQEKLHHFCSVSILPVDQCFWSILYKKNCHNSRTSNYIDMKPEPVTKLNKRNKTMSKKMMMMSYWQIVMSLLFFWLMANLELSGSRIRDAQSVKLPPLLKGTFWLTKTERGKKKFGSSHIIAFTIFAKICWFFEKITDIRKVTRVLILKGIFFKMTGIQVPSIILISFRQGVILPSPCLKTNTQNAYPDQG